MTVIVKYVVERNGKEVMTFASKKEADAYDKQLDIAERLQTFITGGGFELADTDLEELTLYLARHRDELVKLLKGQSADAKKTAKADAGQTGEPTAAGELAARRAAKPRKQAAA